MKRVTLSGSGMSLLDIETFDVSTIERVASPRDFSLTVDGDGRAASARIFFDGISSDVVSEDMCI